jgi:hypothetical protein
MTYTVLITVLDLHLYTFMLLLPLAVLNMLRLYCRGIDF